jgi:AcrR family transcriptional regulator
MSSARPDLLAGQQFPPPPKQARSRQKRDALLQSALALFAERGYEETTIEEIAHHAGVAVGGFYQHFASKRQILLVLMDHLLAEIAAPMPEAGFAGFQSIQDLIAQLVRRGLQVDWSYAGAYRAWREASVQDRELRALAQQIDQWTASLLELLLQGLLQLPGARRDVDSAILAAEINLLFLQLAEVPPTEQAMIDRIVAGLTHLIYHALFTDQAESNPATS